MQTGLDGLVVMVTGASGGIGAETVRQFAAEGARVVIHYHRQRDAAERLARELTVPHLVCGADLTAEDQVEQLFERAARELGPVHVLVANAGIWPEQPVPIDEMTVRQWTRTVTTDLTSVFLCAREFLRGIKRYGSAAGGPAAVLVGSTAGTFGEAGHADYAAAKSGLMYGLLLSLKNEMARLAPQGRANAVGPGWTRSPMTEQFLGDRELVARTLQTMALEKIAEPRDVAAAIVFLASPRLAGHISGQVLMVSGGMEGRVLRP